MSLSGSQEKNKMVEEEQTKPRIKLTPLERTAISTPIHKEYTNLMQVYECGGWKWSSGDLPTSFDNWWEHEGETCVTVGVDILGNEKRFSYDAEEVCEEIGFKILTPTQFYKIQSITQAQIQEIDKYFENK